MLLYIAAILLGFALLIWGADRFVVGAAATAHSLGISHLLIGLTVVGLGTSAPEMLVSANAAFNGNPGLAVGNALGSNIANIALILGVTAIIVPLTVRSETLYRELPMLLAVTLLTLVPFLDSHLSRLEGVMLMLGLGLMLYWLVRIETRSRANDPMRTEFESEIRSDLSLGTALLLLLVGLVVLLVSSHILVWGATHVARELGISDLVIGLTVVALGTSLPELAATISAALKDEHDLAIGNVIGSNMYNLLAVMGLTGAIRPLTLDPEVLSRDFPIMIGLTVVLFAMAYSWNESGGRITRFEGVALVFSFVAYQGYVIFGVLK